MPFSCGFSLASQVATNVSQARLFFDAESRARHLLLDGLGRQVLQQPRQRLLHGGIGREFVGLEILEGLVDAALGVEIAGAAWRT